MIKFAANRKSNANNKAKNKGKNMKKTLLFMMLVASISMLTCCAAEDPFEDFINNGKVRLYGVNNQILSSIENGSGSTVEYYSEDESPSLFAWGNSYENLVILSPFEISEDVSVGQNLTFGKDSSYGARGRILNKFTVTGSTLIANGSGNSISLTAANSFGDVLTIGSETVPAGDITLSGENTFAGGLSLVSGGNIVLNGKKDSESYFELLDDSVCCANNNTYT